MRIFIHSGNIALNDHIFCHNVSLTHHIFSKLKNNLFVQYITNYIYIVFFVEMRAHSYLFFINLFQLLINLPLFRVQFIYQNYEIRGAYNFLHYS